ncbi:DUF5703 domain-containing protein [Sphingobacterium sp.]|uniref:DUF5703 domain-containing protein n=1 Tax=Sphingobacterium sp. TaxID=341027 RepID=UPI0028AC8768|nr:DUF5703 domain-containing protein [Sphingobacterium sp.]
MKILRLSFLSFILFVHSIFLNGQIPIHDYNIKWTSQSNNSIESMPIGGNDIGCNVWVEGGNIYFYFGRSNSFDENNALLKSGRIKVSFNPNPFEEVIQELKLINGYIEIIGKNNNYKVISKLWVEPNNPIIHLDIESNENIVVEAEYQNWRIEKTPIITRWVVPTYIDYPGEDVFWFPDTLKNVNDNIIFYHQNNNNHLAIDKEIIQQDLLGLKEVLWNPLKDMIFGGIMTSSNLTFARKDSGEYLNIPYKSLVLSNKEKSKKFHLSVELLSEKSKDNVQFEKSLVVSSKSVFDNIDQKFKFHQEWWKAFWDKSWIVINESNSNHQDSVWQVGRNYNVFRSQMAANAKGEYPTKFNGGLFTVDPVLIDKTFNKDNPDFRAWGGGVMTAQNQRLLYWPLLKTGDFSMMTPQFDFYRRSLKNAEMRTEHYWGHGGACFTDQMNQAGIVSGREYGWNRPVGSENGRQSSPFHEYYFTSQLEFAFMILEYYRFSKEDIAQYMPFIKSAIQFFDEHYRMLSLRHFNSEFSEGGKYNFFPCMALETYSGNVMNPSDVIVGLNVLIDVLESMPERYVSREEKSRYKVMKSRLPKMPIRIVQGFETISPAEKWDKIINVEIPQLYPVFPWGAFGLNKPNLELARNTWKYGVDNPNQKDFVSWHQDAIFCARMGLIEEASQITLKKLSNSNRRFPTFWGPGHDWVPDHNWGGSGMIGLQEMIIQTVGNDLLILPAWPKEWDVNFKLHAPENTIVEGIYHNGKLEKLVVTPEIRKKDVVLPSWMIN